MIRTTRIDGDVAVGRNIAMGGNADVKGALMVGHNLTVGGWLDARNVRAPNKGLFLTLGALQTAYPKPKLGWYAMVLPSVGSTHFGLYVSNGEGWVNTSGEYPMDMFDVDYYDTWINEVQQKQAELEIQIERRLPANMYGAMVGQVTTAEVIAKRVVLARKGESAIGSYRVEGGAEERYCVLLVPEGTWLPQEDIRLNGGSPFPVRSVMMMVVEGESYVMYESEKLNVGRVEIVIG